MSVEQFLERLGEAGFLDAAELAALRQQVAASPFAPTAQAVAEMLVRTGRLTDAQAGALLQGDAPAAAPADAKQIRHEAAASAERARQAVANLGRLDPEVLLEVLEATPEQLAEADAYGVFGKRPSDPAIVKAIHHRLDNVRRAAALFRIRASRKTSDRVRAELLLSHVEMLAKELDVLQKFVLGSGPLAEAARSAYAESGQRPDGATGAGLSSRAATASAPARSTDAPAAAFRGFGARSPAAPTTPPPARSAKTPPPVDEDLGLAPLDDEEPAVPVPSPPATAAPPPAAQAADEEVILLEDATVSVPPATVAMPRAPAAVPRASARDLPAAPGLTPLAWDNAAGLPPAAGPAGLRPLEPLADLPAAGPSAGLPPLDAVADLVPRGAAGLQPLPPAAGLPPGAVLAAGSQTPSMVSLPDGVVPVAPAGRVRKNPWESPLILFGGGALLLMLILVVALWFGLKSESSAELFRIANASYMEKNCGQAQAEFERFLGIFPDDPKASEARVKIALSRLWPLVHGSGDKRPALKELGTVLPELQQEKAFSEVPEIGADMASLLTNLAKSFAAEAKAQADAAKAQAAAACAAEALQLADHPASIPAALRPTLEASLTAIRDDLDTARRNIRQGERLSNAIADMERAAAAGQTSDAVAIRLQLVKEFPALEANVELNEALAQITKRQRELVRQTEPALTAETVEPPRTVQFQLALASRATKAARSADQQVVCFQAQGTVFALQAGTGQLLWRRFVGAAPLPPRPLGDGAADVLVVDSVRHAVLRLRADSGQLVWRLPVQEPLLEPLVRGTRIIAATRSGRVLEVAADTGRAARGVTIPQPLAVPPCPSKAGRLYVVGDRSNLYVLDESTLECQEVCYLGHKPGSVAVAPTAVLGHVLVAENGGDDYCDLHVLAGDAGGLKLTAAVKPIRLKGRVVTPPSVSGGRIAVVTDLGELHVFEVNAADPRQRLIDAVEPLVAALKAPLAAYPVFDAARLWVASDRLLRYDVQTSTSRVLRRGLQHEGDLFLAPPRVQGDTLYYLRRRERSPACTVTAAQAEGGRVLWETDVAMPLVLLAGDATKKQISALSAQAELFDVPLDILLKNGRMDQPSATAVGLSRTVPFTDTVALGDGRWVLASPEDRTQLLLYDPSAASATLQLRPVKPPPAGGAQVTAPPVALGGGVLLAWDNGQVTWLDPATGANKGAPWQAPGAGGDKVRWQRPAVMAAGAEFVIADDRRNLYRVAAEAQPQPRLTVRQEVSLEVNVVAPLAAAGDTVYAVVKTRSGDAVQAFTAAGLTAGAEWPLEGRAAWGPHAAGDLVLVASDGGRLFCFTAGGTQRWTAPLAYGPPIGGPWRTEQDVVFASPRGIIWCLSGADGKEVGKLDVGEPLAAVPVPFGSRWLAPGSDGTVYVLAPVASNP